MMSSFEPTKFYSNSKMGRLREWLVSLYDTSHTEVVVRGTGRILSRNEVSSKDSGHDGV